MADTLRTQTALLALLTDNATGDIGFQDIRDIVYSIMGVTAYRHVADDTTLGVNDEFLTVDTSADDDVIVNLPAVASVPVGKRYVVKVVEASNDAIVTPNGAEEIDGAASFTLDALYMALAIVSDGSEWHVENVYIAAV